MSTSRVLRNSRLMELGCLGVVIVTSAVTALIILIIITVLVLLWLSGGVKYGP